MTKFIFVLVIFIVILSFNFPGLIIILLPVLIIFSVILVLALPYILKTRRYRPNYSLKCFIGNKNLLVEVYRFEGFYEDILDIDYLGLFQGLVMYNKYKLRFNLECIANYKIDFDKTETEDFIDLTKDFQDYYYVMKKSTSHLSHDGYRNYYIMFNNKTLIKHSKYEYNYLNELKELIAKETIKNNTIVLKLSSYIV